MRAAARTQRAGAERGRDPFRHQASGGEAPRPPGLAGVGIMEAVIRGIVRWEKTDAEEEPRSSGLAILESASGEGFVAVPGDRLLDGVLGRIEDAGVSFWLGGDRARSVHRPLAASRAASEEE